MRPGEAEKLLTRAQVVDVAQRVLSGARTDGECLVRSGKLHPQVRVTVQPRVHATLSAPRVVWAGLHGAFPAPGTYVARTCGDKRCLAPAHLTLLPVGDLTERAARRQKIAAALRPKPAAWSIEVCRRLAESEEPYLLGQSLGIPQGTVASLILRARGLGRSAGGQRVANGVRGYEKCSRCFKLGHRRSSLACPARDRLEERA